MTDAKVALTPMEVGLKLTKSSDCNANLPYTLRPDIVFAVNYLSQFNTYYTNIHFQHAKRVLRYLKGTIDKKLVYKRVA